MHNIIGALICFFAFSGGGAMYAYLFKKKFEETLPLFFFSSIAVLYVSGFFGTLIPGLLAVIMFCVAGLGLLIKKATTQAGRSWLSENVWTFGFLAFFLLIVFVAVTNAAKYFIAWDEYSHWGPMIKTTVTFDSFHNWFGTPEMANKNYPPAIILFEYLWNKLALGYSEQGTLSALQIFTFSLFLPAFSYLKSKKQSVIAICFTVLTLLLPVLFGFNLLYVAIYLDNTLAVLIAFLISFCILHPVANLYNCFTIGLTAFILMATKEMGLLGLLFFITYMVIYTAVGLISNKMSINKVSKISYFSILKNNGLIFSCGLCGAAISYISWKIESSMVSNIGTLSTQLLGDKNILQMIGSIFGFGTPEQNVMLMNYANASVSLPLARQDVFSWTFLNASLLVIGCAVFLYVCFKRAQPKGLLALCLSLPCMLAANSVMIYIIYLADSYAGKYLQSFDRYMLTMLVCAVCIMFMVLASLVCNSDKKISKRTSAKQTKFFLMLTIIIAVFFTHPKMYLDMLIPAHYSGNWYGGNAIVYTSQKAAAEIISKKLDPKKDKLQFLCPNTPGNHYQAFRYYVLPFPLYGHSTIGTPTNADDIWTTPMTDVQWTDYLKENGITHVYLSNSSKEFEQAFTSMFENGVITENTLYEVKHSEKSLTQLLPILTVN